MAALAIRTSAVLCTGAMGIMARPRRVAAIMFPRRARQARANPGGALVARPQLEPRLLAPLSASLRRVRQQTLARPDDAEFDRCGRHVKAGAMLPHYGEG